MDLTKAYREAVEINNLREELPSILGVSRRVASASMSSRDPSWGEAYMLRVALVKAGMIIPRELGRAVDRDMRRVYRWAKNNRTGDSPTYIGEKVREANGTEYIYRGSSKNARQISVDSGVNYGTVYYRLKSRHAQPGSDVTELIDNNKRKKRRKPNQQTN